MSCEPITGCVNEDSAFAIKLRLEDTDGVAYTQSDISGITYKAWNAADTLIAEDVALVVATVISDTLLTTGWTEDSIGYNFVHAIGDDVCTDPGLHIFEYRVTATGGQRFTTKPVEINVEDRKSS